jgi:uncharacterized membrane protein
MAEARTPRLVVATFETEDEAVRVAGASDLGVEVTPLALLRMPIGAGVGALIGRLRESGFGDEELKTLGTDLESGRSALVATIEVDDAQAAELALAEVGAARVVVKDIDAALASGLDEAAAAAGTTPLAPSAPD